MTAKSHRIHGKRVSSSMVLRIYEQTRETRMENHPMDWTDDERSLVTYLGAGSVERLNRIQA